MAHRIPNVDADPKTDKQGAHCGRNSCCKHPWHGTDWTATPPPLCFDHGYGPAPGMELWGGECYEECPGCGLCRDEIPAGIRCGLWSCVHNGGHFGPPGAGEFICEVPGLEPGPVRTLYAVANDANEVDVEATIAQCERYKHREG